MRMFPSTLNRFTLTLVVTLLLALAAAPAAGSLRTAGAQDASESPAPSGGGQTEITAQLPPADLPTGNERQLNLQLEGTLDTDLEDAPTEADVYSLTIDPASREEVAELAEAIGIDGDVEDRGNDTFVVSGEGELFVAPDLIQYQSSAVPTLADLPSDEDAVTFARDWLRSVGLAPADLGEGTITSRTEAVGRISIAFAPTLAHADFYRGGYGHRGYYGHRGGGGAGIALGAIIGLGA